MPCRPSVFRRAFEGVRILINSGVLGGVQISWRSTEAISRRTSDSFCTRNFFLKPFLDVYYVLVNGKNLRCNGKNAACFVSDFHRMPNNLMLMATYFSKKKNI